MATKNSKVPEISKKIAGRLASAYKLSRSIEVANIPKACRESAAASWASANRKLDCWVSIDLTDDNAPAMKYDLRFGHEAKPAK